MWWLPTSFYKARLKTGARVQHASMFLIGVSQPDYARTSSSFHSFASTLEWMQIKYLEETLLDMWKSLVGLGDQGTAYDRAGEAIEEFMEQFHELSAGAWGGAATKALRSFGKMTLDLTLPGTFEKASIGGSI